jgi:hypothetical protein
MSANSEPVQMEVDMGADLEDMEVDIYTEDDMIVEDKFIDGYLDRIGSNILGRMQQDPKRRKFSHRRYIPRFREAALEDLIASYFSDKPIYTDEMFCRTFRMNRPLFLRILEGLGKWSPYFTNRFDGLGREVCRPIKNTLPPFAC